MVQGAYIKCDMLYGILFLYLKKIELRMKLGLQNL